MIKMGKLSLEELKELEAERSYDLKLRKKRIIIDTVTVSHCKM